MTLVCSVVFAACGPAAETDDVPEDRKFANDPVTERPLTPMVGPTELATPASARPIVEVSPETLLRSRGAPDTLYTLSNDTLTAVTVDSGEGQREGIALPKNRRILDFDGSPTGDSVAVLVASETDDALFVAFYRSTGEQVGEEQQVFMQEGMTATPDTAESQQSYTVSWSPQGTGVLLSSSTALERVDVEGGAEPVPLGDIEGTLQRAAWSPQGTRILLQLLQEDGSQRVYVRDLEEDKTREVEALQTSGSTELQELQWLPDGSGLVFVRGQMVNGVALRGQVFVYPLSEEVPRLVATSGQGGPTATITDLAVAPDGDSVAYVISVLDGTEWAFHSMWVRSMDGNMSYQVPVDPRGVVTQLAWIDRGIAWEQRASSMNEVGDIMFLRWDQDAALLLAPAPSEATPVGTPGASPVVPLQGTPGASPVATPIGTPGATPAE
ncbi:MAG TPA: hypothetical protein VGR29_05205 [Thermomicrobiales bacterium]|nr:hypothetical protein [Thermomicrobiales bacterium]